MARSEAERARARLRRWLALFLLAVAVPCGILVYWAYDQLKWESSRRQQVLAEDLADRVDRRLADLVRTEEGRPPEDYGFLLDPGDPDRPDGRRSPWPSSRLGPRSRVCSAGSRWVRTGDSAPRGCRGPGPRRRSSASGQPSSPSARWPHTASRPCWSATGSRKGGRPRARRPVRAAAAR